MKRAKKIIAISTIVSTVLTSILLILLIFDVKIFGDYNGDVIITFACLGIGGFFAINSMNMLSKNRIIGWVSLGLILSSIVLIIFSTWLGAGYGILLKITLALGLLSVLFSIIVSSGLDLGNTKLVYQIIVYVVVFITDLIATLAIFGAIKLLDIIAWFLTLIILSIVGVIILKVFAKKAIFDIIENSKDLIKISKSEYLELKEKAKKYDEFMKNKD